MNPTDIITELRRINAWRRGDETIEQPDPTHYGEVLDAAADEIAKLLGALALGQENCDAEYDELRRERDIARDGLRDSHIRAEQLEARVKELEAEMADADRGANKRLKRMLEAEEKTRVQFHELAALRAELTKAEARVGELEDACAELVTDANAVTLAANLARQSKRVNELETLLASEKATRNAIIAKGVATEQANAELAGALRELLTATSLLRLLVKSHRPALAELGDFKRNTAAMQSAQQMLARHAAGEPAKHPDTDGVALIAAERRRQIEAEGWTPEHDDEHANGEMLHAAMAYQMQTDAVTKGVKLPECFRPKFWPWGIDWWKPSTDPVRNLTKAGALIAAEIDRLQRSARAATPQQATINESLTVDAAKEVQP